MAHLSVAQPAFMNPEWLNNAHAYKNFISHWTYFIQVLINFKFQEVSSFALINAYK